MNRAAVQPQRGSGNRPERQSLSANRAAEPRLLNSLNIKMKSHLTLLLIVIYCFFAAGLAVAQDETARIEATWQVQKYDIVATLPQNVADRNLTVKAVLNVKNISDAPASTLSLRISPNADVSSVTVGGATADFSKRQEKASTTVELQRIHIRVPAVQPGGTLTATVDYKLAVKDNSGVASLSPVGSHFLPMSFWYPTPNSWFFARGADSAPFSLSVVGAQGQFVTSGENRSKDSVYEEKLNGQPFFAVGNWDTINATGATVYVPKGLNADAQKRANELAAIATDAKAFIASLLGTAPDEPIRIVAVRRGTGFAGGGTIFVDESVFRRPKIDSLTAMNVAEAVAKMWIGGAIGITGDAQGTIREGLSRFIATQFIENRFGKDVADVERMRQRVAYASIARRDSPLVTVTPVDDFYYAEVANKGAMIWNLLQRKVGKDEFYKTLRENAADRSLDMAELRQAFSTQKDFLDYMLTQVTDMNLLVGLPQAGNSETKVALRNTGAIDATVTVTATTANGEVLSAPTTIRATSFGEVSFKTPAKVVRAEVDSEKLYPQQDYSDDVAPREFTDSDELLAVKKAFDQQDFAGAEKNARLVLRDLPRFDDVRVLLGRALLAQNKTADAEKEFRTVLDEKLPTARSMSWADVGLGEIASRANKSSEAVKFAEDAIKADGEYGASLAARALRNKLNVSTASDDSIKAYFAQFDKTAVSNRKADLDAMVVAGEATKFANGISGQTEQWQTQIKQIDQLDANNVLVETNLNVKLLSRDPTSGMAVYRMTKVGGEWKLSGVKMFEVR